MTNRPTHRSNGPPGPEPPASRTTSSSTLRLGSGLFLGAVLGVPASYALIGRIVGQFAGGSYSFVTTMILAVFPIAVVTFQLARRLGARVALPLVAGALVGGWLVPSIVPAVLRALAGDPFVDTFAHLVSSSFSTPLGRTVTLLYAIPSAMAAAVGVTSGVWVGRRGERAAARTELAG